LKAEIKKKIKNKSNVEGLYLIMKKQLNENKPHKKNNQRSISIEQNIDGQN